VRDASCITRLALEECIRCNAQHPGVLARLPLFESESRGTGLIFRGKRLKSLRRNRQERL